MNKDSKIYVAGHGGLLGSSLIKVLNRNGYCNLLLQTRNELDLRCREMVQNFFHTERPEYVFLAASRVGSIAENIKMPAEFMSDNLRIQENVISSAFSFGVKKLLFFSSNCCYPRDCIQPMKEEHIMTGPLEATNEAYAIAKIAGMKLCQSYNIQYGTKFYPAVLASLYGPNDHFGTSRAHVIADLIVRMYGAKKLDSLEVVLWGDGSPLREYVFVDDAADAAIFLMRNSDIAMNGEVLASINIGTGEEISIFNLATMIAEVVGYRGKISWDTSRPNGMPRKLLDSRRVHSVGWRHRVGLRAGIERTYQWYLSNVKSDL